MSQLRSMIQVALIEDDEDIRLGLGKFLNKQENMTCPIYVDSMEAFLAIKSKDFQPDVILTDIGLPGMSGLDGIPLIKNRYPDADIIMITIHDDANSIFDALCAGASGYLLKNTPLQDIKSSVEMLFNGGSPMSPAIARKVIAHFSQQSKPEKEASILTPREKEVVQGLVDGLSYKMIADRVSISIDTVRHHIKNIYKKLHVNTKADVIRKAMKGEI